MALSLRSLSYSISFRTSLSVGGVRWASKGNRACRQDGQQKGQEYGWKKRSGQFARAGEILVKQRLFRFHPGLNVKIGEKCSLHAAVSGKVLVTAEKINFKDNDPLVEKYFGAGNEFRKENYAPSYAKYYHVIPEEQPVTFRLVHQY